MNHEKILSKSRKQPSCSPCLAGEKRLNWSEPEIRRAWQMSLALRAAEVLLKD